MLRAGDIDAAQRLTDRFLAGRAELLSARMSAGRIVDGHGDLLADDIFCLDDGPRILDCLEFDDRLRWLDGLDDAAFLAMDLERLGEPALAEQFTRWYLEFSGDPAPTALRHHYVAYRAFVRAKVACIQAGQGEPHAAAQARQLTAMTLRHLRAGAVTLVLIGGLPATGKSVDRRGAGRPARLYRSEQRPGPQGAGRGRPRRAVGGRRTAAGSTRRSGPSAPTASCSAGPPGCWPWASR